MTADLREGVDRRRHHWSVIAVVTAALVLAGLGGLHLLWDEGPTGSYLVGVFGALVVVLATTRRAFRLARREVGPEPITPATWVTVGRGGALIMLAGFLLSPSQEGMVIWLPGLLFAVAAAVDALDGAIARRLDCESKRGERLDVEIDALTVLVGSLLAVQYDVVPVVFVVVGIARYAFVGGIHYRQQRGREVYDLDQSNLRRGLGGAAMLTIWLALLPTPGASVSRLLAWLVLAPFLFNFTRDWLVVSGRISGSD